MLENKYINEEDVQEAKKAPLNIVKASISAAKPPTSSNMVKDHLLDKYSESVLAEAKIFAFTPRLIPPCSGAAASAIEAGMKNVDHSSGQEI